MKTQTTNSIPLLTFRLGNQDYALPIEDVVEVMAMMEVVKVAGAHSELLGLVNRHETVLPLLDLRLVFEQSEAPIGITTLFIVGQKDEQMVGLVVDEVLQVEYAPITKLSKGTAPLVQGIISHRTRLIQVISLASLIAAYLPDELEV